MRHSSRSLLLKPWPKLFQNCRSSRETELAEEYPVQVVCSWIGNSVRVAAKHYLQVTEDHFSKAVQYTAASECIDPQEAKVQIAQPSIGGNMRNEAAPCESTEPLSVGDTGLEPVTSRV